MTADSNLIGDKLFGYYQVFCEKYHLDGATPKGCEVFALYLIHGEGFPAETVSMAIGQIRKRYRIGNQGHSSLGPGSTEHRNSVRPVPDTVTRILP